MTVSRHLNSLVSDIKNILPNDISKVMAFLLEKFPEDFVAGCQLKPGTIEKHFSPKEKNRDFDESETINALISWYFTQSVVLFDRDFSKELVKTEGVKLDAKEFLRLIGNPVYIPLENKIYDVLGCLFMFSGARYKNPKKSGYVIRIDTVCYHSQSDDRLFSKGDFAYQVDDEGEIPSDDFIEDLKENTNLDKQAAIELTNKLFYLLSDEPETIQWRRNNLDFKPEIVKHKRRANTIYAPKYPRLTLLGSEFGEEIRKASTEIGGERTVRPHIRRAHWHTFLCGIGRAQRKIRWIKPVFVHSRDMEKKQ